MKKLISLVLAVIMIFAFAGCDMDAFLTALDVPPNENEAIPLSFVAELYDNHGITWMSIEGKQFDIQPNKVKQYSYSSSGDWISEYELSSVVTVEIDGKDIETCGSTVLIYDTRLEKLDIEVPKYINTESDNIENITENDIKNNNIQVDGYIPLSYAEHDGNKIDLYKKLEKVSNLSQLEEYENNVNDIYGKMPANVSMLIEKKRIDILASEDKVRDIKDSKDYIDIYLSKELSNKDGIGVVLFEKANLLDYKDIAKVDVKSAIETYKVIDDNEVVLEVKFNEILPEQIAIVLSTVPMIRQAYSKFATCRSIK